jgi:choline dehydrogenase-like flavoprotein
VVADISLAQTFDAIVVGSGATGGWAAKRLSEAGLTVALLEAGRNISPSEFTEHMPAYKLHFRDMSPEIVKTRPVQKQCYACMEYNYDWFVNVLENPYSTPKDKPFTWQRLRIVGGRTLVWGRQSYRLSDLDFKAYSHDGYGQDWPISYADLAPFYDIVEDYVGISGSAESNPALPDGHFLPPHGHDLRRRVHARAGAKDVRPHRDDRARRHAHEKPQRAAGLSLLRALRTRVHHLFLLQQSIYHG